MESDKEFCEDMMMMVWLLTRKQRRGKTSLSKRVRDIFRNRVVRETYTNLIQEMRLNDNISFL